MCFGRPAPSIPVVDDVPQAASRIPDPSPEELNAHKKKAAGKKLTWRPDDELGHYRTFRKVCSRSKRSSGSGAQRCDCGCRRSQGGTCSRQLDCDGLQPCCICNATYAPSCAVLCRAVRGHQCLYRAVLHCSRYASQDDMPLAVRDGDASEDALNAVRPKHPPWTFP